MSIDKETRKTYEKGREDREKKDTFSTVLHDVTLQNPDKPEYDKGRRGEQLDGDKKRK